MTRRRGPGALLVKWNVDSAMGEHRQNCSREESDPNSGPEGGLE